MTGKQRAALRKMANTLETILYIGKEGIGENTIREAEDALEARELIKGCVQQGAPLEAKEALTELCEKTGAEPRSSWIKVYAGVNPGNGANRAEVRAPRCRRRSSRRRRGGKTRGRETPPNARRTGEAV